MLAFSALVAGSFALGSRSANTLDPGVLNAIRFAIAVLILFVPILTPYIAKMKDRVYKNVGEGG